MNKLLKDSNAQIERRCAPSAAVSRMELRRSADGMPTLLGYAAVFNSRTSLGWYDEEIAPGAFGQSLSAGDDVRALYNHDSSMVIGRRTANTLRLSEDDTGLKIEIDLPDTTAARDLVANIESGNIDGMSFGFRAREQDWIEKEGQPELRRLLDVELIEVSPVTFPAYPDTSIAKRSRDQIRAGQADSFAGQTRNKPNKPQPSREILRLFAARR